MPGPTALVETIKAAAHPLTTAGLVARLRLRTVEQVRGLVELLDALERSGQIAQSGNPRVWRVR